ncbi:hypothetical protein ACFOHQ_00385 [Xanthomonas fragariae]
MHKRSHLHALPFVCKGDLHSEQMLERIDRHVRLAAFLALIAVIAMGWPTLVNGLQRVIIDDHCAGFELSLRRSKLQGSHL